jgi:hypothetical protein
MTQWILNAETDGLGRHYYLQGTDFSYSAFPAEEKYDVWPVTATDYWLVGRRDVGQFENLVHGDPADLPMTFEERGASPPAEPEPPYRVEGNTVMKAQGDSWVPLKTFDGPIGLAWSSSHLWVQSGSELHGFDGSSWSTLSDAPGAPGWLQVDGHGRPWLVSMDEPPELHVYDGTSWTQLPMPDFGYTYAMEGFAVKGYEAWILTQRTAYRWNGRNWDTYSLGVVVDAAPYTLSIRDDAVYFGNDHRLRFPL